MESKHSSDICSLSNAILHCEALRTHTADALGVDKVMTALIKRYFLFHTALFLLQCVLTNFNRGRSVREAPTSNSYDEDNEIVDDIDDYAASRCICPL